jgi:coenzyme PQQ precursor peptide PqqA
MAKLRARSSAHAASNLWGVSEMTWETPTFVEVKMDAEINSYQEDFDDRF